MGKHCRRYQLDVFTRIISGKLEERRQIIDVFKKLTLTIVLYLVSGDYFKEFGCVAGVTEEVAVQNRHIVLLAKENCRITASQSVFCCYRLADIPKHCSQALVSSRIVRLKTCCVCPIVGSSPWNVVVNITIDH